MITLQFCSTMLLFLGSHLGLGTHLDCEKCICQSDPPEFQQPFAGSVQLMTEPDMVQIHVSKNAILDFKTGQQMRVYKDGFAVVWLEITEPTESGCVAKIVSSNKDTRLKNGDTAIRDTTLNCVARMDINDEYDTTELATKHANADWKRGLRRILTFGQPQHPETNSVDDETQLPTHAAAGCVVSKPMVQFIDQYNQTIRKLAKSEQLDTD